MIDFSRNQLSKFGKGTIVKEYICH